MKIISHNPANNSPLNISLNPCLIFVIHFHIILAPDDTLCGISKNKWVYLFMHIPQKSFSSRSMILLKIIKDISNKKYVKESFKMSSD